MLGLVADLPVEVADLRLQFLDARMVAEQRRGLLGELRAQGDALLGQPAHQFGIEHLGGFDRLAGAAAFRGSAAPGFGVGLLRARGVKLRVQLAQLLVDSVVLLVPTNRLDLARKSSTRASASATLPRRLSISPDSH